MVATRSLRATALGTLASMVMLAGIAGPVAAASDPTFVLDLPAGLACQFDLRITGYGDGAQVNRVYGDGAIALTAGKGYALTYTNLGTGASISTKASGAVSWTASYPDGSGQMSLMGNNVVILFPADGGPSTTVYSGRVVIDVAPDGAWTVQTIAATALDVCAALS
jgi:hypothetical protein